MAKKSYAVIGLGQFGTALVEELVGQRCRPVVLPRASRIFECDFPAIGCRDFRQLPAGSGLS